MFSLIIGGAASGKSSYAERLVTAQGGERLYIATMQPFDGECHARIARHRELRRDKGFATLECYTGLAGAAVPSGSNVLLECMGNLVANERYSPDGAGENTVATVLSGVDYLLARCQSLTIVTNEVFSGGSDYEGDTVAYLAQLAEVNRLLARRADMVVEVVAGLPNYLKGGDLAIW